MAMLLALTLGLTAVDVASAQPGEGCCRCLQCPQGDFCSFVGDSGRTGTEVCAGCDAIGPNDLCSPECCPVGAPAASHTGLVLAAAVLVAVGATTLVTRRRHGAGRASTAASVRSPAPGSLRQVVDGLARDDPQRRQIY